MCILGRELAPGREPPRATQDARMGAGDDKGKNLPGVSEERSGGVAHRRGGQGSNTEKRYLQLQRAHRGPQAKR